MVYMMAHGWAFATSEDFSVVQQEGLWSISRKIKHDKLCAVMN
jgi:hypothetical protein